MDYIVTVNDYLAKEIVKTCQKFIVLGVTCGFINNNQDDEERLKITIAILRMPLTVSLVLII